MGNYIQKSLLSIIFIVGLFSCDQTSSQKQRINQDSASAPVATISDSTSVLFVQWQYPNSVTGLHALDVRQRVEGKIQQALNLENLGHWIAGDLGPGGANMLFEVSNLDKALLIIMDIIKNESIDKETVIALGNGIAQRGANPSNWKVIYPKDYKGIFNDM